MRKENIQNLKVKQKYDKNHGVKVNNQEQLIEKDYIVDIGQ